MGEKLSFESEYRAWLVSLKGRFRSAQLKAARVVNSELLQFYWELGADIVAKQIQAEWGSGFLKNLSADLREEFPDVKGFSDRNINNIRKWYLFYNKSFTKVQQAVAQIRDDEFSDLVLESRLGVKEINKLIQIPWGHNVLIVSKCKSRDEALYYVEKCLDNSWSRSVLTHQIESDLWRREGSVVSNFDRALPAAQSDLAKQIFKDPYIFDFMALSEDCSERELESMLVDHITKFLLELGAGFAYMGRQYLLKVGTRDFYIDLLFYHTILRCYVIIELKTGEFEPEYMGKLNFYLKAIDEEVRSEHDQTSIGILLCKGRDNLVAEYSLSDVHKPMGVSEYCLTSDLPEGLQGALPSTAQLEKELGKV